MILDRIKEYIDFKKIAISAFEKSIGMSNASFGKSLKTGGAVGTDKLENILNVYTDLNPMWLLTGEGPMIRPTSQFDQSYIQAFNRIFEDSIPLTGLTFDEFGAYCGIPSQKMKQIYLRQARMDDATMGMMIHKLGLSASWVTQGLGEQFLGGSFNERKFNEEYDAFLKSSQSASFITKPDESILYNMYKDLQAEKREKEAEIKELNAKMLAMSEEIGRLKAKLGEDEPEIETHLKGLGKGTAKNVSTRPHSSQPSPDAPSAGVPSDGR